MLVLNCELLRCRILLANVAYWLWVVDC